ncbi:uncharacterized protein LOC108193327 [Daucus carota subsp. sativus]|uniref:uncharacterized protein LOC108193327 n=1 Tax=Daucus carota subsp. sativus TaxID=79200 RepID=UPI0007EF947A|nr:PREDICTED: uncharacterized protein LOC108193327 [Daucus carota subsp. sativus]XP_017215423.1 PREDICTED: uncharacterized protein LOC108193327 [Daucus carota subsp. sativus]
MRRKLKRETLKRREKGAFKEIKDGDNDEGSNRSEFGNEGRDCDLKGIEDEMAIEERNPENRSVVEGNEIGNEGGDCDLKGKEVIEDYEYGWGVNWDDVFEDYEDGWGVNRDDVIEDYEDRWG